MKVLYNITLNNLKLNKKRTIVTIIGIILATFLMVGVGIMFSSFRQTTIIDLVESNGEYHVFFNSLKTEEIEKLNNKKFVASVKSIAKYSNVKNIFYDSYNSRDLFINSANDEYLNSIKITTGRLPENSKEVIISKNFNLFLKEDIAKFKVGDTISLSLSASSRYTDSENLIDVDARYQKTLDDFIIDEQKSYKIVGIYDRDPFNNDTANVFLIKEEMDSYSVYVTYNNIKDTLEDTKIIVKELGLNKDDYHYNENLLALYGVNTLKRNSLFELIYVFLCLVLVLLSVGVIGMIYNSFSISVSERKKWLGMLSSLGASRSQIYISVLFEALIVGAIGITIGIVFSLIGMKFFIVIINFLIRRSSFELYYAIYPSFIAIPVLFMILVILLASLRPASVASRTSIIETIRLNDDIKLNNSKIKGNRFINKLFGTEGNISYKNMKRNKKKYKATVFSLSLSVILFLSSYSIIDFLFGGVDYYFISNKYDYEIYIDEQDRERLDEIVSRLKSTGEVKKISILNYQRMGVKSLDYTDYYTDVYKDYLKEYKRQSHGESNFIDVASILIIDDESFSKYIKENKLKIDEPILYNFFSDKIKYSDGSTKIFEGNIYKTNTMNFEFCFSEDNIELKRCGVDIENYQLSSAYFLGAPDINNTFTFIVNNNLFSQLDYSKILYENNQSTIRMNVGDDLKIDNEVLKLIEENILTTESYYNIKGEMKNYNNTILAVKLGIYSISFIIALIGITSIFNTVNTSINLRKKEFAIFRSVGMSNKMFNKMICLEGIFLAFKSLLYSIPISLIIHYLLFWLNDQMVGTSKFEIPYSPIIFAIFMVLLVSIITIYFSSSKIKKSNIIDTIREENI